MEYLASEGILEKWVDILACHCCTSTAQLQLQVVYLPCETAGVLD